ncbi:hypothetical protein PCC9214_00942 [Planktothrix tepida]|uniref:Uncharacterized protein n=1 Tax=Planktothrix pseudagardhii TaxID=132604 RepID=A0A9W4GAD5_9CYAN|nr:hypothetical protein PCC9214_00942 [Planktothrix tepida]CAD5981489.1 hypothetical protein NO713_04829 [Planktothrix pseudagardhii]
MEQWQDAIVCYQEAVKAYHQATELAKKLVN